MTDYNRETAYVSQPKYTHRFSANDVRALREELGCGLIEAKGILVRQQIREDLQKGRRSLDVALLYDLLEYMMENHLV